MRTSSRAFALVLAVVLAPAVARGQSAADVTTARDLFKEGMDLRAAGKLPEALAKLKAAHALYETPPSALELGRAQIDSGLLAEGYETLLSVERISTKDKESERSKQARGEAKALAEKVKARIPTLSIDVSGPLEGATVTLDGAAVPASIFGIARRLDPGHHVIIGRGASGEERTIELDVGEGQAQHAALEIPAGKGPQQPPPTPGSQRDAESDRARRFGVLYKFLSPSPAERWTLRDRGGNVLCELPCEKWLGEGSGTYLERVPVGGDSPKRVEIPAELPAPVGTTVSARPHAGKGSPGLATVGGIGVSFGVLGLVLGPIFLFIGVGESQSQTGRDFEAVGGVMTGVSAALFGIGLPLALTNAAPRLDLGFTPATGQPAVSLRLLPSGIAGVF